MASSGKKTKRIRHRKKKPNKANQKANQNRIQRNAEMLKELVSDTET